MMLTIKTTGQRKALAALIGETIAQPATYAKMPTCAYHIGSWQLDREGILSRPLNLDSLDEINMVLNVLAPYHPCIATFIIQDCTPPASNRIRNFLESKGHLITKAIPADIAISPKKAECHVTISLHHPDLTLLDTGGLLFLHLANLCRQLNYVSNTQKAVENEKYAFRCFLLRLGFIGNDYKAVRKTLMQNFTGNSAIRGGYPTRAAVARLREQYPQGATVELVTMHDPYSKLQPGDRGTVLRVDDIGTIHVSWECGGSLGVAYGEDKCKVVEVTVDE